MFEFKIKNLINYGRAETADRDCRRFGYAAQLHYFDESTAMLDPQGRGEVMQAISI